MFSSTLSEYTSNRTEMKGGLGGFSRNVIVRRTKVVADSPPRIFRPWIGGGGEKLNLQVTQEEAFQAALFRVNKQA
jgi:hypothetical protein